MSFENILYDNLENYIKMNFMYCSIFQQKENALLKKNTLLNFTIAQFEM